ncbi:MAG TPA: glycosyltransferase family 4 protein [Solirubrobacteraceae bacterium]|nr:glycosyltransferase family 4 protein [Solirubrobacteraceae bacterium]
MKILVVSTQFPYPPRSGSEARVYQLMRQLARRHEVTLLSYAMPDEREDAAALAAELTVRVVERSAAPRKAKRAVQLLSIASRLPYACREVRSQQMQRAIDELCAQVQFDVIQLESLPTSQFSLPIAPKLLLDEHNIEYELLRRQSEQERSIIRRVYNRVEHARVRRFEQSTWERVDGCLLTSERELEIVRRHAPGLAAAVVPNGVDLQRFQATDRPVEPFSAVFNGVLDYRPNVDAALYLVDQIWPLVLEVCPQARLSLVGRAPPSEVRRLGRRGVTVTGEVADIRPYLERATVVVVPMRMGGGTRLKVVESLALSKATVSSSLGCEGIAVTPGRDLLTADDPRSFAEGILELFENEPQRRELGRNGRALVEREYSWDLAGEQMESFLEALVAQSSERVP